MENIIRSASSREQIVEGLKTFLKEERAAIEAAHRSGAAGSTIVRRLSDLADRLIIGLARTEAETSPARGWSLVALGGYGRSELNPYSDIDLMFLYDPASKASVAAVSKGVLHTLWDLKFSVGHSIRTIADCQDISRRDIAAKTSLLEARHLFGDEALSKRFIERMRAGLAADRNAFISEKVEEMNKGYEKHGSSIYMLEPNVKKSGGGLRDIHFLRWIALARFGANDLDALQDRGAISSEEFRALNDAQEFLWRVRNDMHFAAGQPADTLSFDEQVRLANCFGYRDDEVALGVERFMQQYYIHASEIHEILDRFVERMGKQSPWKRLTGLTLSRRVADLFILTDEEITVPSSRRDGLLADPAQIFNLFYLAQVHGLKIDHMLLDKVRHVMEETDPERFQTPAVARRFVEILSFPGNIANTLSLMHRTRVLGKFLPEFWAVNRLVQFNQYHKYTVDEHSLMVIRKAEALLRNEGILGKTYRDIKRKDILHLAMLLHDIGKGQGGDHSAIGAEIAQAVARRIGYEDHDTRLLVFLVHQHLMMSHIAFRRDLTDEKVLLRFARTVANPETLKIFFVLTYADISGVGPGTWTEWKEELLTDLYTKVMDELTGSREVPNPEAKRTEVKAELVSRLKARYTQEWIETQADVMDDRYVLVTPIDLMLRHLEWISELPPNDVLVRVENVPETDTTEYTVLTFDDITPGLFSKIAGVLAAKGLQILSAQVDTRKNGVVVDTFRVSDTFYTGPPPQERLDKAAEAIRGVLLGTMTVEELFQKHRRYVSAKPVATPVDPTKVEVDNESSDVCTIIDIFAQDKQGLLYVITKGLFDLGLSISSSKIATRLDQIVDVFYVKDRADGKMILDPQRIETIEKTLIDRIEAHAKEG